MSERERAKQVNTDTTSYQEMERLYVQLFDLGYREMPDGMYRDWLRSLQRGKGKYFNKQIRR